MQVVVGPELPDFPPSVVVLGNFDGIHVGHTSLLKRAIARARRNGLVTIVVTFFPHPQVLLQGKSLPMLLSQKDKEAKLAALGIEFLVKWPFTTELMQMTPEGFVGEVLAGRLNPRIVCVGFNFTFGCKAAGTAELLIQLGRRYGFDTEVEPPVTIDGVVVSSSAIRAALGRGDITGAHKMLGHRPYIRGTVVGGDRRGRTLGFPTANVLPPAEILWPTRGVYAARAHVADKRWPAVVNIGYKPTFGEDLPPTVEVYLMGYGDGELYGREMVVEFWSRLREEKRFTGPNELKAQIQQDVEEARRLLELDAN